MSRRRSRSPEEPGLFDLPLDPTAAASLDEDEDAAESRPEEGDAGRDEESVPLPLFEGARRRPPGVPPGARPAPPRAPADPAGPPPRPRNEPAAGAAQAPARDLPVSLSARFLAGLADLAVHVALAVVLLFGARLLGVPAGLAEAPALIAFLLLFSFFYTVIPLAFWGQTPGMAWAGIAARTASGESLTFGQTARRWLGGLLTVLLLGLPTLLAAAGGPSLTDRLSDSRTRPA